MTVPSAVYEEAAAALHPEPDVAGEGGSPAGRNVRRQPDLTQEGLPHSRLLASAAISDGPDCPHYLHLRGFGSPLRGGLHGGEMLAFPALHAGDWMNSSTTKGPAPDTHGDGLSRQGCSASIVMGAAHPEDSSRSSRSLLPGSGPNRPHEAEILANCTSEPTSTAPHCPQVARPAVPVWAPALQRAVREASP